MQGVDYIGPLEHIVKTPEHKSKSEYKVHFGLTRHYEPINYEQPWRIYNGYRYRVWHPDFTIVPYDMLLLEYLGLKGDSEYDKVSRYKARVYGENNIQAVFLYPDDIWKQKGWVQALKEIVEEGHARLIADKDRYDGKEQYPRYSI